MRLQIKIVIIAFIFSLLACKKKTVIENVFVTKPAEYSMNFGTLHSYLKNVSGSFDTLVSFWSDTYKIYPKSKDFISVPTTVTCNGYDVGKNYTFTDKFALLKPNSDWRLSCSEEPVSFNYIATIPLPYVTNKNWFNVDSIKNTQDLVIDLSAFRDYDVIEIFYGYDNYILKSPQSSFTIKASDYNKYFSNLMTIGVTALKDESIVLDKKNYYYRNGIRFVQLVKIYK